MIRCASVCSGLVTWLVLFCVPLHSADLFSKYYKDVATSSVSIGPNQLLGTVQEDKLYLTEVEAVQMALVNNLQVNIQRYVRFTREWEVRNLEATYDPQATIGFNWNRTATPATSLFQGGISLTNILTDYSFGYSQAFSTGSSFEVAFNGNRNRTSNFFSNYFPAINTSLQVLFRQNLLEGFGQIAPEYQIEISRNNLDVSEYEFKQRATEIIFQVQDLFWELQYALEDIRVKQQSVDVAETLNKQNQARFEVGTAARLDVVQSEAEVAIRREELIRAKYNYRSLQDRLVQLITNYEDPRSLPYEIVPAGNPAAGGTVNEPFDTLLAIAAEMRPEFQVSELQIANQRVNVGLTRNQLRPTLDLVAGYQQFGLGGNVIVRDYREGIINAPIIAEIPGGLKQSLDQLVSGDYYGYVVGLNLALPIFNTDAKANNAKAQISLREAEMANRSLRQSIALEIRDALTQIQMNGARIESTTAAVRNARERLTGEEARFEVGMGTTRELIETQRDLLVAALLQNRAKTDLIKNHALLDRVVGRTFERFNILLADALEKNVTDVRKSGSGGNGSAAKP